jgi:hypothetical protein
MLSLPLEHGISLRLFITLLIASLLAACTVQTQQRRLITPAQVRTIDERSPFLKAHLLDGRVYILSPWKFDARARTVSGPGELLGINRELMAKNTFTLSLDSVALFETNVVKTSGAAPALALITGASVALTIYCAANPKACFGSCPTFYVSDGERPVLQAEGFSASVTRALEARDIDALFRARPTSRDFAVQMKNEALETHVVRYVEVLPPRPQGVVSLRLPDGVFWQAQRSLRPAVASLRKVTVSPHFALLMASSVSASPTRPISRRGDHRPRICNCG